MRHDDRQMYLIGENRVQNELMRDVFRRELGCQCVFEKVLHSIPDHKETRCRKQRLVLIDCSRMDIAQTLDIFCSHAWKTLSCDYRVLFNLIEGSGIEQNGLNHGVRGFFYTREGVASLLKGIRAIFHEELWISRKALVDHAMSGPKINTKPATLLPGLSFRETEVVELLAEGYSNKKIADQLCISPFTVKSHLNHIFRKIEVSSRLQAIRWREQIVADRS